MQRCILASQSPRRRLLLKRILAEFEVTTADVEEATTHKEGPEQLALHNASIKSNAIAVQHPDSWVIGSDTVVALDSEPLGKPQSRDEALDMISSLSGKKHQVHSGVCITNHHERQSMAFVETTSVTFFTLSESTMVHYVDTMGPYEFAGGYPIQHLLGTLVAGFDGSYTNVVGLPLEKLRSALLQLEILKC